MEKKIENIIGKILKMANELKDIFVERDRVIDNSIKALITGQTVLFIGPPGTAKSALTNALCNRIEEGRYFSWLLNRTSDPSEILGPYSIKAMEKDKFLRVTTNKLPQAEIAFLDEIFKCNEPTLNVLLPIINEKLFYNDGNPVDVPLITLFAASNEFPEEDSLMALYDRMMFRMHIDYIKDTSNKLKMFKGFLNGNESKDEVTVITLDELSLLRKALDDITIDDVVLKEYISLMNVLFQNGITVSDRRQNECLKVLRVNALLEGREKVELCDFLALRDVLWSNLEEIERVEEILKERTVSPFKKEYNLIKKRYGEIVASTTNLNDVRIIVEIKGSIEYLYDKINRILRESELMEEEIKNKYTMLKKEMEDHLDALIKLVGDEDDLMYNVL